MTKHIAASVITWGVARIGKFFPARRNGNGELLREFAEKIFVFYQKILFCAVCAGAPPPSPPRRQQVLRSSAPVYADMLCEIKPSAD